MWGYTQTSQWHCIDRCNNMVVHTAFCVKVWVHMLLYNVVFKGHGCWFSVNLMLTYLIWFSKHYLNIFFLLHNYHIIKPNRRLDIQSSVLCTVVVLRNKRTSFSFSFKLKLKLKLVLLLCNATTVHNILLWISRRLFGFMMW